MSNMKRRALYAGSFDPPTAGHIWMIREGVRLFDELVVAIGTNPEKQPLFSVPERLAMLRAATRGIKRVRFVNFDREFLIARARRIGAQFLLRGLRNKDDYEFERAMRHVNADIHPGITTVFLMPPREIAEVSSSMVKSLVGPRGWEKIVARYVPPVVLAKLKTKNARV